MAIYSNLVLKIIHYHTLSISHCIITYISVLHFA